MTIYLVLTHGWNRLSIASFTEEEKARDYAKEYGGILTKLISSEEELDAFLEQ